MADEPPTFRFAVSLAAVDAATCDLLLNFFGVGHIFSTPRRQAHYDDEVTYQVRAFRDLVDVIVPFMDEHLPPSYRRKQYEAWKAHLLDYWEHRAKRVRPCAEPDCDDPRRAKGLCRHHYYLAYGR